jgi:ABC-2 type transport system permease protein
MQQVRHIFKKEFKSYFVSPIAYIVIGIFLLVSGWFFFTPFFLFNQASLRNFEILLTMPVTILDIVLGKFLASVVFVAAMLMPTVAYPITVSFLGQLDWGPVVGGYIGAVLLGGAFSAIGLFASSLTRNQIIAFIVGMAICFALTLIDKVLFFLPQSLLGILGYLGADFHFQNISKGIVDSRDILYFFSVCFVGLYGTHLAMQEKR